MMYSYVWTSGVRAMFAVWRLPESWIGPYFCVASAAHGVKHVSRGSVASAAVKARIVEFLLSGKTTAWRVIQRLRRRDVNPRGACRPKYASMSTRTAYRMASRRPGARAVAAAVVIGCVLALGPVPARAAPGMKHLLKQARRRIRHVVVIMQENRSFDSYFGTYPHADGIRMRHGVPSVCVPDPATGGCARPFHDPNDVNYGGP